MGRHRRKASSTGRQHTIIALSALVPGGLIAAATSAHAGEAQSVPHGHVSIDAAAAPPDTIPIERIDPATTTPTSATQW